jgi:hypothetical protein
MLLLKGFLILIALQQLQAQVNFNSNLAKFLRNHIEDLNLQDSTTRDVIVLRLGMFSNSSVLVDGMFESIVEAVPEKNPLMVSSLKVSYADERIRKAAVIVIASDVFDTVRMRHSWLSSIIYSNLPGPSVELLHVGTDFKLLGQHCEIHFCVDSRKKGPTNANHEFLLRRRRSECDRYQQL